MKTKEIDPKLLGHKEDWLGNSAALECPVCGRVYIVSSFLKHECRCPGCGEYRASITGSPETNGKAVTSWDYSPTCTLGRKYTRESVGAALGGSESDYLPMVDDRVVCGCFTLDHNPEAPDVAVPGTGKIVQQEAAQFRSQDYPLPIVIKRRVTQWAYVGDYKPCSCQRSLPTSQNTTRVRLSH
jgi:hypothetical protein